MPPLSLRGAKTAAGQGNRCGPVRRAGRYLAVDVTFFCGCVVAGGVG